MITISLCMIVKNEQAVLKRCLDSVREAVDEIIIVDTGSTDLTKKIAGEFTKRIYDFEWRDDFSAARNFAFSKASCDYQMWLDADDVVPPSELKKLIALKSNLPQKTDIVTMKYIVETDEDGRPTFFSTRERLLKREKNYIWQDPVHECIPLIGEVYESDISIMHQKEKTDGGGTRNLDIYAAFEKKNSVLTPRQLYYYARELMDHRQYQKSANYFKRFLDTGLGWVEDNIAACYNLGVCYRILGKKEESLAWFVKSFDYAGPRAEACCEIGYHFKAEDDMQKAADWFGIAAMLEKPNTMGFCMTDYWGFIPHIELCVCHYALGQLEKAEYHNQKALEIKPKSRIVLDNQKFFESLKAGS